MPGHVGDPFIAATRVLSRGTRDVTCVEAWLHILLVVSARSSQGRLRLTCWTVRCCFCAVRVNLTQDADCHVCYNFSGGGKKKCIPNSRMTALKTSFRKYKLFLSCGPPVFNTLLIVRYALKVSFFLWKRPPVTFVRVCVLSLAYISFVLWPYTRQQLGHRDRLFLSRHFSLSSHFSELFWGKIFAKGQYSR